MRISCFIISAIVAVSAVLSGCSSRQDFEHPVVGTAYGRVQGYMDDSVAVFKGVPYARAERFMPAHEPETWDTIMVCTKYGDIAMQPPIQKSTAYVPTDTTALMSEDCLNLNIWTSARAHDNGRPVMVWLHGGAFDYGSSHHHFTFNGTRLARTDNVVVVTLNHRLNALGFLDFSEYGKKYAGSGNLGMTDILQALKWIKENIAAFGGDPENVTIFGHGSGGIKVMTLMTMPSAKGYYHKAIIQSGTLEGLNQPQDISRKIARLALEEAGVKTPEEYALLPYDTIWETSQRAVDRVSKEYSDFAHGHIKLAPVVDGDILPRPIFTDSCINVDMDVPVILGSTFSEFTTRQYLNDPETGMEKHIHRLSSNELEAELDKRFGDKKDAVKLAFAMAYPDRPLCEVLVMDSYVRSKVLRMAHFFAKRGDAPVYVYIFSWVSPLNNGYAMSFRCSELPFVFNQHEAAEFSRAGGDEARRLGRIMSRCWTSFARSGNPNNSITPFWRRINLGEGHTMVFDRDVHLESYPDLKLMQLLEPESVKDIVLHNQ